VYLRREQSDNFDCFSCCRGQLSIHGLDTAWGSLLADLKGQDGLVYDLMELERGTIDGLALNFVLGGVIWW